MNSFDEERYTKLLPWLIHPAAITDKLREVAGDAVLKLLNQSWTTSGSWDQEHLNLPEQQSIWCREIVMLAHNEVCWYARSVFPKSTFTHHPEFFAALNHLTLGDLIFNSPGVHCESLTHYPIRSGDPEYHWLPEAIKPKLGQILGLRLATYRLVSGDLFYLVEIFLPAMEKYC